MRGKISDQDLTDYALDELEPRERLYVESMLAVSEECRNDIYESIELAQMLEEGFEREEAKTPALLTMEQRQSLLRGTSSPRRFVPMAAAALAAAACAAFVVSHPTLWQIRDSQSAVAQVSTQVSNYVVDAVTSPDGDDLVSQFANFRQLSEDPAIKRWLASEFTTESAAGPTSALWDVTPRSTLELAP
jgi:anti-sigma factor RsiW